MKYILLSTIALLSFYQCQAQLPWKDVHQTQDYYFNSLASTNNGYVYVVKSGELYKSTKNGDSGTFSLVTTAPTNTPSSNDAQVYAYGDDIFLLNRGTSVEQGIWRSSDYGATWKQFTKGISVNDYKNIEGIAFIDSGCMMIVVHDGQNPNKYLVSNDRGASWTVRLSHLKWDPQMVNIVRRNKTLHLFSHYDMYTSDDNGITWTGPLGRVPIGSSHFHSTVVLSDGTLIRKDGYYIITSADGGITWQYVNATGIDSACNLTQDMVRSPWSDTLYVTHHVNLSWEVLMSADRGVTWSKYMTGLPGLSIGPWLRYSQQLHLSNNGYLFLVPNKYQAQVEQGSLYRTSSRVTKPFKVPIKPIDTSTSVNKTQALGSQIDIYPNPTTGSFVLDVKQNGTLRLLDIYGKEVSKLEIHSGKNHVLFPQSTANGIYIARFESADGTVSNTRLMYQK